MVKAGDALEADFSLRDQGAQPVLLTLVDPERLFAADDEEDIHAGLRQVLQGPHRGSRHQPPFHEPPGGRGHPPRHSPVPPETAMARDNSGPVAPHVCGSAVSAGPCSAEEALASSPRFHVGKGRVDDAEGRDRAGERRLDGHVGTGAHAHEHHLGTPLTSRSTDVVQILEGVQRDSRVSRRPGGRDCLAESR